jgi:proteasome activator subunit 4
MPNLIDKHLRMLVCDTNKNTFEGSHKLASEICAALIRGSKYWPLSRLNELWCQLKTTFDLIVDNVTQETLLFWYSSFSTAMEDQDPRRMHFYIDYFKKLVEKKLNDDQNKTSSFQNAACLSLMHGIKQFEWRIPEVWFELNLLFESKMNHSYKVVREKIAK